MANVRAGNTYYVDTTGNLTELSSNERILMILLTATAANAIMVITDNSSPVQNKFNLRLATSGDTKRFNFVGAEVHISQGLRVDLTNATATIILKKSGG